MSSDVSCRKGVTRRGFLTVAVSAIVAGVVAGIGAYYAGTLAAPAEVTKEVTKTIERTTTVTAPPLTTTVTKTATTTTTPPTKEAPKTIKIGAPLSVTGLAAGFGMGHKFGLEAAVEDINKLGGVYLKEYGKRIPIELLIRNHGSDPLKAASMTTELITLDEVAMLVSPLQPPTFTNPMAAVSEKYKVPALFTGPYEPWAAGGPYKYTWAPLGFSIIEPGKFGEVPQVKGKYKYAEGYSIFEIFWAYTKKFADQTNKVVGILACDDADGRGWYDSFSKKLGEIGPTEGFKVVGLEKALGLYPPGTTDFSSIIAEWKAAGVEILWANLPGPDFGVAARQMAAVGFKPKIRLIARAALFYEDVSAWGGDIPYGVGVEMWWSNKYPVEYFPGIGGTTPMSLYERWHSATGLPLNQAVGLAYGTMQVAIDALERAGTIDRERINEAMAEVDVDTIAGHTDFKGVRGQLHYSPAVISFAQWVPAPPPENWKLAVTFSTHPFIEVESEPIFPAYR